MSGSDLAIGLATGVLAGVLAGVLGTGGGFLTVPVMVLVLDRAQTLAQGTSLVAIIATASVGTFANARRRTMPWPTISRMAAGGVVGAAAGAMVALHLIGESWLRRVFGVMLILTAVRVLRGQRVPERGVTT